MAVAGLVLVVVLIIAVVTSTLSNVPSNEAEQLCQQAKTLENQGKFTEACDLYWQALPLLLAQNSPLTQQCREGAERLVLSSARTPLTRSRLKLTCLNFSPMFPPSKLMNG